MKKVVILSLALTIVFFACKKGDNGSSTVTPTDTTVTMTPYTITKPLGFPDPVIPADNKMYVERIDLGRRLYYDPILSPDGSRACASCHMQKNGFTSDAATETPVLPHVNLAWYANFMWDGSQKGTLEDVMKYEVEDFFQTDVSKVNANSTYRNLFKKYYGADPITAKDIEYALAQFIRTEVSGATKFELVQEGKATFTADERQGYQIFFTEKGDCYHCHAMYTTTDNAFHNIGLDSNYDNPANRGLYNVTGNEADMGKFRTPNLRNCALRDRFMHDGRFHTLDEVIEHYNSGVILTAKNLDPIMTKPGKEYGLQLTDVEKGQLKAFLETFTDTAFINNPNLSAPR